MTDSRISRNFSHASLSPPTVYAYHLSAKKYDDDYYGTVTHRMEIHWWWVGLSFLVLRVPNTASVDTGLEPLHDFDLGPLRCCPRPRNSDICPEMNEYIPCTIASEIERRENRIDGVLATYPSFVEANCTATVRKILCEQNFPTCVINPDGSHEVLLPSGNACKQSLEDDCSIFPLSVIEEACSLYEPTSTNYSVDNCSAPIITLNHCTVDWYVPEWILQYVKQIDIELDAARKSTLEFLNENCWEKFKEVRCKSVGRCWAQGTRLELIISNETCDEALSW